MRQGEGAKSLGGVIRTLFARREDPYAGNDLDNARRLTGLSWIIYGLAVAILLPVAPPTGPVTVESGITVKDLSQALGVTVPKLITFLMGLGAPKTVTISRRPGDVQTALLDPDLYGRWTEMVDTRFEGEGPPTVGTRGEFRLPGGPLKGRYAMEIVELTDLAPRTEFTVFKGAVESGGKVRGINAKGAAEKFSRKGLDELTDYVKTFKAKGLVWLKVEAEALARSAALQSASAPRSVGGSSVALMYVRVNSNSSSGRARRTGSVKHPIGCGVRRAAIPTGVGSRENVLDVFYSREVPRAS